MRILVLALAAFAHFANAVFAQEQQRATAHFISVNQGESSLLEFPCGVILIDLGGAKGSGRQVIDYLEQMFERRPDLDRTISTLVLTDHPRNLGTLLKRFKVNTIVSSSRDKGPRHKPIASITRNYPQVRTIWNDAAAIPKGGLWTPDLDQLDCDGDTAGVYPDVRLLWGDVNSALPEWSEKALKRENNHSGTVLVTWGTRKLLFTGDLEKRGLQELVTRQGDLMSDIDIYQVSHHGLRSGTPESFLRHIRPRIAIMSRPAERALYEPTLDQFNAFLRTQRSTKTIPVWNFDAAAKADEDTIGRTKGKFQKIESTATVTGALYWTGQDGTVRIDLSDPNALPVEFGPFR